MSAWSSGKLPASILEAPSKEQEDRNSLLDEQRREQSANEQIDAAARSLVSKVESAISGGGGTPQANKQQCNYGVKGKYLDCVIGTACGIWSGKGPGYTYRYNHFKPDWGENQTNFEKNVGGWTHNVHVTHA